MLLFEILSAKFSVYAIGDSQNGCESRNFLSTLGANLQREGIRMLVCINRMAERGPDFSPDVCHQVEEKLYQLSQGSLRVLWFYDRDRIIICTHGFIKKTRKTPKNEKKHAKSLMGKYFEEKKSGSLKSIPWNEDI